MWRGFVEAKLLDCGATARGEGGGEAGRGHGAGGGPGGGLASGSDASTYPFLRLPWYGLSKVAFCLGNLHQRLSSYLNLLVTCRSLFPVLI